MEVEVVAGSPSHARCELVRRLHWWSGGAGVRRGAVPAWGCRNGSCVDRGDNPVDFSGVQDARDRQAEAAGGDRRQRVTAPEADRGRVAALVPAVHHHPIGVEVDVNQYSATPACS
jgi:hypothetical protein